MKDEQPASIFGAQRTATLDLDRDESIGGFYDEIYLDAAGRAPHREPSVTHGAAPSHVVLLHEPLEGGAHSVGRDARSVRRAKSHRDGRAVKAGSRAARNIDSSRLTPARCSARTWAGEQETPRGFPIEPLMGHVEEGGHARNLVDHDPLIEARFVQRIVPSFGRRLTDGHAATSGAIVAIVDGSTV